MVFDIVGQLLFGHCQITLLYLGFLNCSYVCELILCVNLACRGWGVLSTDGSYDEMGR